MSGGMPDSRLLSRHLGAITRAIRIHDVSNQAVSRLIGWSARDLTKLSADSMDARVEVDVAGVLVVNNIPQRLNRENRTQLLPLAAMLRKVDAGGFAISGPVSPGQLLALFSAIYDAVPGKSRAAVQSLIDGGAVSPLQLIGPRVLISGMVGGPGDAVRLAASESLQAYIRANLAVHTALAEGVLTRIPPAVFRSVQALADLARFIEYLRNASSSGDAASVPPLILPASASTSPFVTFGGSYPGDGRIDCPRLRTPCVPGSVLFVLEYSQHQPAHAAQRLKLRCFNRRGSLEPSMPWT